MVSLRFAALAFAISTVAAKPKATAPASSSVAPVAATTAPAAASFTPVPGAQFPNNWNWQHQYPPLFDKAGAWAIPPIDSPQAKQWIAAVNMSAIPNAPVIKWDANGNPINPFGNANPFCDWTFDGVCTRPGDVVYCPQKGVWGLSFDDGPTPYGSQLYDFLATENLKASLFYIGIQVAQNPQVAAKGCAAGHHISIHTWSHHVLTSLTTEQIIVELKWTETIIKEVCGITPKYFRPPQGDYDDRVRAIAAQLGYTAIIWDLDTNDWMFGNPGSTLTTAQEDGNFTLWINQEPTDTHGHIVLEHELSQTSVDEAKKNIPRLQSVYTVMPVASCIKDPHPYLEQDVFFPIMGPTGQLVWTNTTVAPVSGNSTTPAAVNGTSPSGTLGNSSVVTSSTGTTATAAAASTAHRVYAAEALFAVAAIVAIAMAF
ncbi:hypothetical protein BC937DRAFT_89191 [Endogone sp. FLAS-F59071]|nr:hypothetical protein BC937DRAFT_89191 [Endogone sp. FLAS-F59071]|eukprot:RUS18054.1 hypothetical protein BC937DRAFT_89191 [Endogone sp. FLAS-F59071]